MEKKRFHRFLFLMQHPQIHTHQIRRSWKLLNCTELEWVEIERKHQMLLNKFNFRIFVVLLSSARTNTHPPNGVDVIFVTFFPNHHHYDFHFDDVHVQRFALSIVTLFFSMCLSGVELFTFDEQFAASEKWEARWKDASSIHTVHSLTFIEETNKQRSESNAPFDVFCTIHHFTSHWKRNIIFSQTNASLGFNKLNAAFFSTQMWTAGP